MFWRNHFVVAPKHVNPIAIKKLEQIHPVEWIAKAIPFDRDLL